MTNGELGLASGAKADGTYERLWFDEPVSPDEVSFEASVFLLTKAKAKALKTRSGISPVIEPEPKPDAKEPPITGPIDEPKPGAMSQTVTINLRGTIPPEMWNRLGTKLIPKLRSGSELKVGVDFSLSVDAKAAASLEGDLRQALEDLGLLNQIIIEKS